MSTTELNELAGEQLYGAGRPHVSEGVTHHVPYRPGRPGQAVCCGRPARELHRFDCVMRAEDATCTGTTPRDT